MAERDPQNVPCRKPILDLGPQRIHGDADIRRDAGRVGLQVIPRRKAHFAMADRPRLSEVWKAGCVMGLRRLASGTEGGQSANFLQALENVFPPVAVIIVFLLKRARFCLIISSGNQSSVVAPVLAQKMLSRSRFARQIPRRFERLIQIISRVSFPETHGQSPGDAGKSAFKVGRIASKTNFKDNASAGAVRHVGREMKPCAGNG